MLAVKYRIFDQMIEGVQVINNRWQYIYVNETVTLQGKFTKKELLGSTMLERYPGIENTEMFLFLKKCMADRIPHQMVNDFTFPDGSIGFFELRMQPVDEGVLIMSSDVTHQKRAEHILVSTNALLDQSVKKRTAELTRKNEELERIAHMATHDLREPLLTLHNYLQTFEEEYKTKLDPAAQGYLQGMKQAADRVNALAITMIDFMRQTNEPKKG